MNTITRRTALAGFVAAPAGAVAAPAEIGPLPCSAESLASHRRYMSAEDRMKHHLLMAAQALDELADPADPANGVWHVSMDGQAPLAARFVRVSRMVAHEQEGVIYSRSETIWKWSWTAA